MPRELAAPVEPPIVKPGISAVLFDVGGVLVALDGMPMLAALLEVEPRHEAVHALWTGLESVRDHESGKIAASEFARRIVRELGLAVSPTEFLDGFIAWPTNVYAGAIELLQDIPNDYEVAVLSNTSAIHWERITAMGLTDHLPQAYLSHETGHLKPSPAAYLSALDGMRLPAEEVLFIDDGPRNVAAANALGMNAHIAKNPDEARSILTEYGVVQMK